MQHTSVAGRRALSVLASKLHPPLPLSPRESQQLLTLLTTSFRAHLDREHPVETEAVGPQVPVSHQHAISSRVFASQHIDSILSNPLLARNPRRRGSHSTAIDALADPLNWFLDEIATGTADLKKATLCLDLFHSPQARTSPQNVKAPATTIATWLQSSGLETSKEFAQSLLVRERTSLGPLLPMLLAEDNLAPVWRWFARPTSEWVQKAGMTKTQVSIFRTGLLRDVVRHTQSSDPDRAIVMFLQAYDMVSAGAVDASFTDLQPAGAAIVNEIIARPEAPRSPGLYTSFSHTALGWLSKWSRAVQAMLSLHHPTQPDTKLGLAFILHTSGAAAYVNSSKSRRQFVVRLCLGVAARLLEEEKFAQAQVAMDFAREHFADIVLTTSAPTPRRASRSSVSTDEQANLDLLDRLLPT